MKLSTYAQLVSISYAAAHRQFKAGKIKGAYQLETGHIVVPSDWSVVPKGEACPTCGRCGE